MITKFLHQWWCSLAVLLVITITTFLPQSYINTLALIVHQINQGEWWRIITGHFIHVGVNHALLNIMGYLIIISTFRTELAARDELITLLLISLGCGLGIYYFNQEIHWYGGLSGVIHGLLAHSIIISWRRQPLLSGLYAILLASKLLHEHLRADRDTFTSILIGAQIMIESHLYGTMIGVITGLTSFLLVPNHNQHQ